MPEAIVDHFDGRPAEVITFDYKDLPRATVEAMARTEAEAAAWLAANPTEG